MESIDLSPIFSAIVALQSEVQSLEQNAQGGGGRYKYTTLGSLLESALPILTRHGVSVIQPITENDGGLAIQTIFIHTGGAQWTAGITPIPDDNGTLKGGCSSIQNLGANLTYMRRYSLASALGIASEKDTDGVGVQKTKAAPPISVGQKQQISSIVAGANISHDRAGQILGSLGISKLAETPATRFDEVLAAFSAEARSRQSQTNGVSPQA
jgi:hypothetical protein